MTTKNTPTLGWSDVDGVLPPEDEVLPYSVIVHRMKSDETD